MKLFSRKAIVAATTAVAISAGSLSAPAMAAENSDPSRIVSSISSKGKTAGTEGKTEDPIAKVKSVLSIISTVVAILGALFPLASQIMKKFGIGK
ncbi:hypothetical protein FRC0337_01322 [Corynebacterium diphtheriae]|nr:hypothetical protein FRC0337_01322 [Corynebacterium diphtheriae]